MKPFSLLIPVPDVPKGLAWYQKAFPMAEAIYLPEFDFTLLQIDDFQIEIVQADQKVQSGHEGVVLYWYVENLMAMIQHLEALGATLYRGPLAIENNLQMCQFRDPFGNLIGLKGSFSMIENHSDHPK